MMAPAPGGLGDGALRARDPGAPASGRLELVLTGTGTSVGVPQVGCRCAVCRSDDPRDKRLRASALLRRPSVGVAAGRADGRAMDDRAADDRAADGRADGRIVVIDTGMDFRAQMLAHGVTRLDAAILTHSHVDHIGGLDDVRPFCHYRGGSIPIYGMAETLRELRLRFPYIWNPQQQGGGLPQVDLHPVDGPFEAAGVPLTPLPAKHGLLDVVGYRVGDTAYLTDVSAIPDSTRDKLAGLRYLVLGAVQREPHHTHFNVDQAVAEAEAVGAEMTWLTHMNHQLGYAWLASRLPPAIRPAHDGLVIPVELRRDSAEP